PATPSPSGTPVPPIRLADQLLAKVFNNSSTTTTRISAASTAASTTPSALASDPAAIRRAAAAKAALARVASSTPSYPVPSTPDLLDPSARTPLADLTPGRRPACPPLSLLPLLSLSPLCAQ